MVAVKETSVAHWLNCQMATRESLHDVLGPCYATQPQPRSEPIKFEPSWADMAKSEPNPNQSNPD